MSSSADILVLVNPTSGGGRAARIAAAVRAYLRDRGASFEIVETRSAEEMQQRAGQAASQGFSRVAALGGDGAVHFVMAGVFGTGAALGIIPAGSGDDIAAGLAIPPDPAAAAHALLHAAPRAVDVLRIRFADGSVRHMIGAGGIGLDAQANQLATTRFRELHGAMRYVAAALWALKSARPLPLEVTHDGGAWRGEVLIAAAANCATYGGGIRISPDSRMDDGVFELVIVQPLGWTQILEAIPVLLRDGHLALPEIVRIETRRCRLQTTGPSPFHGDGEILGHAPLEIELLPNALPVIAPAIL